MAIGACSRAAVIVLLVPMEMQGLVGLGKGVFEEVL